LIKVKDLVNLKLLR